MPAYPILYGCVKSKHIVDYVDELNHAIGMTAESIARRYTVGGCKGASKCVQVPAMLAGASWLEHFSCFFVISVVVWRSMLAICPAFDAAMKGSWTFICSVCVMHDMGYGSRALSVGSSRAMQSARCTY